MKLSLGIKTDPIEYRYTFDWLFDLMADCGVGLAQLGSFFEMYWLDREWFLGLREKAEQCGIRIKSVFTAHRELGGFMTGDPALERVTARNHAALLDVGEALGVDYVGMNIGAAYRDRMDAKEEGVRRCVAHLKEMTRLAKGRGFKGLTVEPMSCLAEPPTLAEECAAFADDFALHRAACPDTVPMYFCGDISHGYAGADRAVAADNWSLFECQIPHMCEFHFKNTDAIFNSTFGFGSEERKRGIVDLARLRGMIEDNADRFPVENVTGYLELNNIKLGRDYTDAALGAYLRESVAVLRDNFDFSEE